MGFRAPLDLSDFIKEYQPFIEGRAGYKRPLTNDEREYYEAQQHPTSENSEDPRRWGFGPEWCSTETALMKAVRIVWDVNGYYRRLGISTDATRAEMRLAFHDGGHIEDPISTYYLTQLLNARVRAEYDAMPLGSEYEDDIVSERRKAQAREEAFRRWQQSGSEVTAEQILDEWRMTLLTDESSLPGTLDNEADSGKPDAHQDQAARWDYSYYLWRSGCQDTERLAAWQALLVSALAERGEPVQLRLGYVGKQDHPYVIGRIGLDAAQTVFVNDRLDPNAHTAGSAADALLRELRIN